MPKLNTKEPEMELITLPFGKQVTLDEFLDWNPRKQNANMRGKDSDWYRNLMKSRSTPESQARQAAGAQTRAANLRGRTRPHGTSGWYYADTETREQAKQRLREWNAQQFATPESRVSRSLAGQKQFATKQAKQQQRDSRCRPVMTPIGQFPGSWAAAQAMGITVFKFYKLIKENPKKYYYLCGERGKPIVTPAGTFISSAAAMKHYKVGGDTLRRWMVKLPDQYYRISLEDYIKKVGPKRITVQNRGEILAKARAENCGKKTTQKQAKKS
jgi:hypothetical protein